MRFVSLFAGVGGFDLGLEQAGYTCVGQVEIDKHAVKVLQNHWPNVPKHDDVQTAKEWADEQQLVGGVDLVCGGFPCQDLSVAGKRAGLDGARSGLFYDAVNFATHVKAKWIILENVPGLLSSNNGADFIAVISTLRNAGYSYIEWRVFNSQFYGVPQRRRRIYIVAGVADPSRFPIFVERESSTGDSSPSNEARENSTSETSTGVGENRAGNFELFDFPDSDVAPTLNARRASDTMTYGPVDDRQVMNTIPAELYHHGTVVNQDVNSGHLLIGSSNDTDQVGELYDGTRVGDFRVHKGVAPTVISRYGTGGNNVPILDQPISFHPTQTPVSGEISPALGTTTRGMGVFVKAARATSSETPESWREDEVSPTLNTFDNGGDSRATVIPIVNSVVRRLTPVECERLQGFPDDWTAGQSDSHRYKQMGNAVTVNVIRAIGELLKKATQ